MITATIRDNGFRIEGHANYAPSGQDIVCAGVSALTGAIMATLNGKIVEKGDGLIDCMLDDTPALDGCLAMLCAGLLNIQQQYPKHVRVVSDE